MSNNGFDPKDVEEICSREKLKFRMKKADYKELGLNALSGSVDVVLGALGAVGLITSQLPKSIQQHSLDEVYEPLNSDNWKNGPQGYGYYRNGKKD